MVWVCLVTFEKQADALKQTCGILDVEGIVEAFDAEEINPN